MATTVQCNRFSGQVAAFKNVLNGTHTLGYPWAIAVARPGLRAPPVITTGDDDLCDSEELVT